MLSVPTDAYTDAAPTIQSALDAGGTVQLPAGQIAIWKPLRLTVPGTRLLGVPGQTSLYPYFGSGHAVVAQPPRPFPYPPKDSLVSGPGQSVHSPRLPLDTEPALARLAAGDQLTVSYFFRRESPAYPNSAAVHVHCGSVYGASARQPWSVWDYFGSMRICWDGQFHYAANPPTPKVGVIYFVALVYDGARVRLLVAEPGQPLQAVIDVPTTGNVPMLPNGLDVVAIGYNAMGVHWQMQSHGPPDATFDGFEFASVARYKPGDAAPTVKPSVQPGSRLVLNFEQDGPFLLGRRDHPAATAYILPMETTESPQGGYEVSGITFMGAFDASGPVFWDAFASWAERLNFVGTWYAITYRGVTYASKARDMGGVAHSVFWLQTGQSMDTTATGISPSAGGIPFVVAGPAGGSYTTLYTSPLGGAMCSLFAYQTNEVNVFNGQVDDEGQAGQVHAAVIADGAEVKLFGVQAVRQSVGPVVICAGGGSVHLFGSWLSTIPGSVELIHFDAAPRTTATVVGCRRDPTDVPLSLTPQHVSSL